MTLLHDDALARLRDWRAAEPDQERLRQLYVDHLESHADGLSRGDHPDHVTTGALVLSADHDRVLLTLHARAGRWFHLGGHCEAEDTTLVGAAQREAVEESGIPGLLVDPDILHLDAHVVGFCSPHEQVRHLDVRFLAVAPPDAAPVASAESVDVRWWPVDDLPTEDAGLQAMVRLALSWRQVSPQSSSG